MDLEKGQEETSDPYEAEILKRRRQLLQDSQDAWVRYRSANCDLHAAKFGAATMGTLDLQLCYVDMTKERTQEIARAFAPR
jgi:uncharacterized protein YecT (DUF1311 family)